MACNPIGSRFRQDIACCACFQRQSSANKVLRNPFLRKAVALYMPPRVSLTFSSTHFEHNILGPLGFLASSRTASTTASPTRDGTSVIVSAVVMARSFISLHWPKATPQRKSTGRHFFYPCFHFLKPPPPLVYRCKWRPFGGSFRLDRS